MRSTLITVRWGELDPYGHVNHAVYLTYLETGRIEALGAAGWSMDRLEGEGLMILVAEMNLRFRRPAEEGDHLAVLTAIDRISGAATHWRQEIRRGDELLLVATVIGAITDLRGRVRRVPPEVRTALERLIDPREEPAAPVG
jgi:acyl-CoA thioester hydrolase